jgi:energy-coupling factor transporter ATP-binding protein EcfA2
VSEILTIRNFGPIKDVTIELRHVNILIGDQGTGKSTVAKVLMAVKATLNTTFLADNPHHHLMMAEGKPAADEDFKDTWKNDFAKWLDWTGLTNSVYPDSFISFKNEEFSFLYNAGEINISSSEVDSDVPGTPVNMYIPAYREVAIVLKDKLFAVLQAKATLPDILTRFGTGFLEARAEKSLHDYRGVFGVMYRHSNGMDYIVLNDGKEILIEDASSALRNGVPMLVVFDNMLHNQYVGNGDTARVYRYCPYLIIEEPELNCFPETQEKMMKYFIEHIKEEEGYKNRLLITTHSPYILTSLNNLMQAYQTGKVEPGKADAIIPKQYWLNSDDVSSYMLLTDGTCKNIVDREENLIMAEEVDSVSRKLNAEFNSLVKLEIRAEV